MSPHFQIKNEGSPCSRPCPSRPQLLCPSGLLSPTEQVGDHHHGHVDPVSHGNGPRSTSCCVPQNLRGNCCRYSAEEYARKFGSAPAEENLTNDIDDAKPLAKEEGSLLSTVVEIAMKFVPLIIDTLAGSTGPSQTDRLVGLSDL